MSTVRSTVLPGGLRILTESVPTFRSATFGIWVGTGSRDETPDLGGATHYLEHLLFKGTARRTALQISAEIDAVGGEMNAFTSKEFTCYYARVLDDDLPLAIDVVSDMLTSALNRAEDVDAERGVVLEEIAMTEDDPGDQVHDLFAEAVYGDTPLGRPVLGTVDSINSLSRDAIHGHYLAHYGPRNLVVAAAGNVDHDQVVRLVERAFAGVLANADRSAAPCAIRPEDPAAVSPAGTVRVLDRSTEQAHIVLGMPGVSRTDERRWALGVLNAALGGGMSSRLFQEVREKRGLAYSVYSFTSGFAGSGLFGIYAGCQPQRTGEVLKICRDELDRAATEGIGGEELRRAVGQVAGATVLALEDTGALMNRLGKGELCHGGQLSVDELLGKVNGVTEDQVREVARDVLAQRPSLALIGPFRDKQAAAFAEAVS
ncbi:M16 family metallopeptidase [Mangrovactinospora gilvigrisea]|nr:pitrilysin family protein [Mangrovactinospora gilvigrisea]